MAQLLSSSLSSEIKNIPENYVFPPEKRPGDFVVPIGKACVPILDFNDHQQNNTIHHIIKACQDFGFFQVINHGVSSELMGEAMEVFKEVFNLSPEEKYKINMEEDVKRSCRIYTSSYNYEGEGTHYWRDALRHSCNPIEECIKFWPLNPPKYREVVRPLVTGMKDLGSKILNFISQGLELEPEYFENELSEDTFLTVNHYPPCPDPSLTLGLTKHTDPNLITFLIQDGIPGLQVLIDGQWMSVETLPNAFLVFIGNQLEIISNGNVKSGVHRVVTNAKEARTSAAFFINPTMSCIVEPAKSIVQVQNGQPFYKTFQYKDFFDAYTQTTAGPEAALHIFKYKHARLNWAST